MNTSLATTSTPATQALRVNAAAKIVKQPRLKPTISG